MATMRWAALTILVACSGPAVAQCPTPPVEIAPFTGFAAAAPAGPTLAVGRAAILKIPGEVRIGVTRPGRYRVAAGAGVWLDLLAAGKPLASVAHGHGEPCSGIRKIVDFDLKPGMHVLRVTVGKAGDAKAVTVMMVGG